MHKGVPPLEYQLDVQPKASVIYMLRTVQQHHVQLSMMADQKASFLIAASFLMITLMFGRLAEGSLSPPLLALVVFTVPAALFAVLTVIPRSHTDVTGFNPLFFGTFARMTPEGFLEEMRGIMESDEQVYRAMALDIYQMGTVLYRKKYRYLAFSYRIFLSGLIVAAVVALAQHFSLLAWLNA